MLVKQWVIDVSCAAVGEGAELPYFGDVKGFTKLDLMAYVITVHGPSIREDIMRMVAALEQLPWISTSNTEYFSGRADNTNDHGTLKHSGKRGRKQLYDVGIEGQERALPVILRLGEGPARAVK